MQINKYKEGFIDLIMNIIVILVLVIIIRSFLVAPFRVSGPSMCDTLNNINGECVASGNIIGEFMLVNKLTYIFNEPKRGDIIVFRPTNHDQYYIKRIIGIEGDTIEINKDGFVYLTPKNGEKTKLNETYLNTENYGNTQAGTEKTRIFKVPNKRFFVMGDNRSHSSDSRYCFSSVRSACITQQSNAFIGKDAISGKALITLWPYKNFKLFKEFKYNL